MKQKLVGLGRRDWQHWAGKEAVLGDMHVSAGVNDCVLGQPATFAKWFWRRGILALLQLLEIIDILVSYISAYILFQSSVIQQ